VSAYDGKLWVIYDGRSYRIDRADPRVTMQLEWIEYARAGHVSWARVVGDVLTVTADRTVIYRLGEHGRDEFGRVVCRAEWPD
jgi:hypothetical protein